MTTPTTETSSRLLAQQAHAERMRAAIGTRAVETLPFGCRCGSRWSGWQTAHCGACHLTFSGVSTFDVHRRSGHCASPRAVGLSVLPGRSYECWGTPSAPVASEGWAA